jgi:hypothetical protein
MGHISTCFVLMVLKYWAETETIWRERNRKQQNAAELSLMLTAG